VSYETVIEGMAQYYSKNLAREVMKGMRESPNPQAGIREGVGEGKDV